MKSKEVTRVGGIRTPCNGSRHIVLPKSWSGKRIFCLLKSEWDEMQRQQERKNAQIGKFASALVSQGIGGK